MKFNTYNILFVFLSFQICCCCITNHSEQNNCTSLDMSSAIDVDFDELVENVNCIALENSPDAYMT